MCLKFFNFFKSFMSLLIILFFTLFTSQSNIIEPTNEKKSTFENINNKLAFQKQVDEELQAELNSGNHTFENPLIILDPYNESPLTALVIFSTQQPSKITVSINDPYNSTISDYTHKFEQLSNNHCIPVYALFPDATNIVTLKQFSENNNLISEKNIEIKTEKLPTKLDNLVILTKSYKNTYQDGLNYHLREIYAFDKNGKIRWFLSNNYSSDAIYFKDSNNRFILPLYSSNRLGTIFSEMDNLGKIYNLYYAPFSVHHDITLLPNGNILALSTNGETTMDFAFELDTFSGEIVNTMDFKKILQRTRFKLGDPDWLHANSITYDETDDTIILSSNAQSTIAKIKWPEGNIKWILSSPTEYLPKFQQYLLKPINEDFEYSYNQHDVNILPDYDDNPNTIDISVFDNGRQRPIVNKDDKYSRLVHYRINEQDMTIKQIWQYGKERTNELFSYSRSSFKLLPNANRLGLFCITINFNVSIERLVEVDKNSNLIWDAEIFSKSATGNVLGYQVYRLPFYATNEEEHDVTITARNVISQNILNKNL